MSMNGAVSHLFGCEQRAAAFSRGYDVLQGQGGQSGLWTRPVHTGFEDHRFGGKVEVRQSIELTADLYRVIKDT